MQLVVNLTRSQVPRVPTQSSLLPQGLSATPTQSPLDNQGDSKPLPPCAPKEQQPIPKSPLPSSHEVPTQPGCSCCGAHPLCPAPFMVLSLLPVSGRGQLAGLGAAAGPQLWSQCPGNGRQNPPRRRVCFLFVCSFEMRCQCSARLVSNS